MNKVALLSVIGSIFLAVLIFIGCIFGYNNSAVRMEKAIQAQYEQNQNARSQFVTSVMEAVQIPTMYKDDFKEVILADMEGRYGKDGSKATFNWIKERNLDFNSAMYTKLQNMIEAGRAEFAHEQKLLIDKKRAYKMKLDSLPGEFFYAMLGFPKINLDKYNIVKSADNNKVFSSGTEAPMKLR